MFLGIGWIKNVRNWTGKRMATVSSLCMLLWWVQERIFNRFSFYKTPGLLVSRGGVGVVNGQPF